MEVQATAAAEVQKVEKPKRRAARATRKRNGGKGAARKHEDKVALHPDLERYKTGKTEDGRRTLDIGDATAKRLRGLDLDAVYKAAGKALGETEKDLRARYRHLNPGMQRMNLGNRMRAAAKAAKGSK